MTPILEADLTILGTPEVVKAFWIPFFKTLSLEHRRSTVFQGVWEEWRSQCTETGRLLWDQMVAIGWLEKLECRMEQITPMDLKEGDLFYRSFKPINPVNIHMSSQEEGLELKINLMRMLSVLDFKLFKAVQWSPLMEVGEGGFSSTMVFSDEHQWAWEQQNSCGQEDAGDVLLTLHVNPQGIQGVLEKYKQILVQRALLEWRKVVLVPRGEIHGHEFRHGFFKELLKECMSGDQELAVAWREEWLRQQWGEQHHSKQGRGCSISQAEGLPSDKPPRHRL